MSPSLICITDILMLTRTYIIRLTGIERKSRVLTIDTFVFKPISGVVIIDRELLVKHARGDWGGA